jgi:large subunit ribosomal protein L20
MRTTNGAARHQSVKRVKKLAKGYYSGRHKMYRVICEAVKRAERMSFYSRKRKKRDFRRLWITRIGIACRLHGLPYSRLIFGLHKADIRLDRRQLSELAINQPDAFAEIIKQVKTVLGVA